MKLDIGLLYVNVGTRTFRTNYCAASCSLSGMLSNRSTGSGFSATDVVVWTHFGGVSAEQSVRVRILL